MDAPFGLATGLKLYCLERKNRGNESFPLSFERYRRETESKARERETKARERENKARERE